MDFCDEGKNENAVTTTDRLPGRDGISCENDFSRFISTISAASSSSEVKSSATLDDRS